ncbi:MAG: leader peptide SpeFL [Synergistaceae bacterium]|nr:leader peptide SpeFL [Synergistaceae bacterium]
MRSCFSLSIFSSRISTSNTARRYRRTPWPRPSRRDRDRRSSRRT